MIMNLNKFFINMVLFQLVYTPILHLIFTQMEFLMAVLLMSFILISIMLFYWLVIQKKATGLSRIHGDKAGEIMGILLLIKTLTVGLISMWMLSRFHGLKIRITMDKMRIMGNKMRIMEKVITTADKMKIMRKRKIMEKMKIMGKRNGVKKTTINTQSKCLMSTEMGGAEI